MAKVKLPLMSFEAHGSLAGSVSFSRSRDTNLARRIPDPPDARTLRQLYQRWRFFDARYYWRTLSPAQRATWETDARPHQLTGWAWFLSWYLPTYPDLVLWLRCDTYANGTAPDSSGKANHATIFGTTPTTGHIDAAYHFGTFWDNMLVPPSPSLHTPDAFTLMTWLRTSPTFTPLPLQPWLFFHLVGPLGYGVYSLTAERTLHLATGDGETAYAYLGPFWDDPAWHHLAITYDGVQAASYVDGLPHATSPDVRPSIGDPAWGFLFLHVFAPALWFTLDDVRIYNRTLSPEHILGIARSQVYPPPSA